MKRIILISTILILFTVPAHSALDLLGQGTSTHGTYNLIYDTDLDITWYDYSNSVLTGNGWQDQMDWSSALSVTFGSNTYSDWRLPTQVDGLYVWGYDGTTTGGYNITTSEMGHLYYTELENKGYYAPDGTNPQPGYGLTNTGDFQNLRANAHYWSGTEYAADTSKAWHFGTQHGNQYNDSKVASPYAIAVMDGMAVVPEPISSILFLTGGGVLAGRRYFINELGKIIIEN